MTVPLMRSLGHNVGALRGSGIYAHSGVYVYHIVVSYKGICYAAMMNARWEAMFDAMRMLQWFARVVRVRTRGGLPRGGIATMSWSSIIDAAGFW